MNPELTKIAAIIAAIIALSSGMWWLGSVHVRNQWNDERLRQETAAKLAAEQNERAHHAIEQKHKDEIAKARSEAGRTAIAAWLKSHGLLSDGTPMRKPANHQADSASGTNEAACECRTSGDIEGFARKCAEDALTVEHWQEWAIRENLEVQ